MNADLGLTTPQNMQFFYKVLWWAVGQASPWILILFATSTAALVARMVYKSIVSIDDDVSGSEEDYEDDY